MSKELTPSHVQILHKVNAKRTECTPYYKFVCSAVEGLLHPKVWGEQESKDDENGWGTRE